MRLILGTLALTWAQAIAPLWLMAQTADQARAKVDPNQPLWEQKIPLSLQEVLQGGLVSSLESKRLFNERERLPALAEQLQIPYQPQLQSSVGTQRNRLEPGPAGGPLDVQGSDVSVRLSKRFVTGTTVFAEGRHSIGETKVLSAFGPQTVEDSETRWTAGLSHSLWRNRNGRDLEINVDKVRLQGQLIGTNIEGGVQALVVGLSEQYVNAWLAKENIELQQSRVADQKKLLKIVRIGKRRGTSDDSDVIQVQTSLSDLEQALVGAEKRYGDVWKSLVVQLDLEKTFGPDIHRVDPINVLLALPKDTDESPSTCAGQQNVNFRKSPRWRSLSQDLELTQLELAEAREADKAEVLLEGSVAANAYEQNSGASFADSVQGKHPFWTVALKYNKVLGSSGLKSKMRSQAYRKKDLELARQDLENQLKLQLSLQCRERQRLTDQLTAVERVIGLKKKRARIENRDFEIGRSDVFTVIQTQNDLSASEFTKQSLLADLEKLRWQILQSSQKLMEQDFLQTLLKKQELALQE